MASTQRYDTIGRLPHVRNQTAASEAQIWAAVGNASRIVMWAPARVLRTTRAAMVV